MNTLLMLSVMLPGGGCHVKQQKVVVQAVPVVAAVAVPVYSFAYIPPPPPVQPVYAAAGTQAAVTQASSTPAPGCDICTELRLLREEIARLRGGPAIAPAASPDGAGLLRTRCASCHQASKAEASGGGFVLVEDDGKIPPFSLPEKRRILELIGNGAMPKKPGTPLAPAEKEVLKAFIEGR